MSRRDLEAAFEDFLDEIVASWESEAEAPQYPRKQQEFVDGMRAGLREFIDGTLLPQASTPDLEAAGNRGWLALIAQSYAEGFIHGFRSGWHKHKNVKNSS